MADALNVGLVGLGTIGTGVVRIFQEHGDDIERRLGFPLRLAHVADIDLETDRGVSLDGYRLSRDYKPLVQDPELDLVVELVGGTTVAADVAIAALVAGKGVVTANKALLAHRGDELYALAREHGTDVAFEAAVGGTIPVLRALREGLASDRIESVHGIVNGTCNYVLTQMEEQGEPYAACLKRAQELGYAEADPTFDVDGTDSAHKLVILVGLALGVRCRLGDFPVEGIERVSPTDIEVAGRLGLRVKLLASARRTAAGIVASVRPTLVPRSGVLAGVGGAMNAVEVHGAMSGPTLYYGAGAGSLPTAVAVVSDLMELARSRRLGAVGRVPPLGSVELADTGLADAAADEGEHFVRVEAAGSGDPAAALVAGLAQRGVALASLERTPEAIVATTRPARRGEIDAALAAMRDPGRAPQVMRIEREP